MRTSDGGAETSACTDGSAWGTPTEGVWVHVAGVFDTVTGTIRAYVMGDPLLCGGETAQATFSGSWSATGSLAIGRARDQGAGARYWRGDVDEVYAFQRALPAVEICEKAVE
jgi:hypothetical protein